jgi:hypothetical protein
MKIIGIVKFPAQFESQGATHRGLATARNAHDDEKTRLHDSIHWNTATLCPNNLIKSSAKSGFLDFGPDASD